MPSPTRPGRKKAARVLSALCGAAVGLLAARFIFCLLLANPANPVTTLVLRISRSLLFPWDRLWPPASLPLVTVEHASLAALALYAIIGLVLAFLGREAPPVEEKAL